VTDMATVSLFESSLCVLNRRDVEKQIWLEQLLVSLYIPILAVD
jgi:hypothetical protein